MTTVKYNDLGQYEVSHKEDTLYITPDEALVLVRALYSAGLEFDMPNDQTYLQGRVEAMTEHLADMRRLVMDGLPGEKE